MTGHPLLDTVSAGLRDRLIQWITKASPSARTLDVLLNLYLERAPYADVLLQYMMLTPHPEKSQEQKKLTRLVNQWRRDRKPLSLEEIDFNGLSMITRKFSRGVGFRLLKGIEDQQVQPCFLKEVRILLPDVFLRPLGWRNFSPYVPPVIIQIAEVNSGAGQGKIPDDFESIAVQLYGYVSKIYIKEVFLIAAALMNEGGKENERNSPMSIRTMLKSIKTLLDFIFNELKIKSVAKIDPDVHIREYLYTELSEGSVATRLQGHRFYVDGLNAVERWRRTHPQTRLQLGAYCLPALKAPIDTTALALQASRETQSNRHGQLNALMPVYLPMLAVVRGRASGFSEVSAAFDRAWLERQERGTNAPYPFVVPFRDGSATLQFAILAGAVDRAGALCEYLGAVDASGQPLPLPYFAMVQRGWYDEDYRAVLAQYGISPGDCDPQMAGLLTPASASSAICRNEYVQAQMENRPARIYLSVDALCAAAAFGSLAIMTDCSSDIRIHETLQIRIEAGYFDVEDGYTVCLIYQKGHKRAKLEGKKIYLEPLVTELLRATLEMKRKCNGVLQRIHMDGGKEFGFSPGPYLFQWSGGPIYQRQLRSLIRFMAFGVTYKSPSDKFKKLRAHDMRHAHMRGKHALGHSVKQIQRVAEHVSERLTLYYLGLLDKKDKGVKFEKLEPITLWESMMPDAIQQLQQRGMK